MMFDVVRRRVASNANIGMNVSAAIAPTAIPSSIINKNSVRVPADPGRNPSPRGRNHAPSPTPEAKATIAPPDKKAGSRGGENDICARDHYAGTTMKYGFARLNCNSTDRADSDDLLVGTEVTVISGFPAAACAGRNPSHPGRWSRTARFRDRWSTPCPKWPSPCIEVRMGNGSKARTLGSQGKLVALNSLRERSAPAR